MMNVKRILSILLVMCMTLGCVTAMADEAGVPAQAEASNTLVVGSTTALSGNFFSEMFGNNASDLDVRTLLHGYNLMQWQGELGSYGINRSVVSGVIAMDEPDGSRTYTVTLYSNLKYSDGTPITAEDYAFTMLLSMAPEMKEIGAQTVYSDYMVGADEYVTGETNVLTGLRLLNSTTLAFKTKASYKPFFYELALLDYNPYPIHIIAPGCEVVDNGEGIQIQNIDKTIEEPIFTSELLRETILDPETGYLSHPAAVSGAYMLDSYDPETHVAEFSINPYFNGDFLGRRPVIEHLVYRLVTPDTMVDLLVSGEVGLLNKCTSAETIDQGFAALQENDLNYLVYPRSGYSFVSFNCEKPVVNNQTVRQAIAYCMDEEELVQEYVEDYGVHVIGYYGIGQWMYPLISGEQEPPVPVPPSDANEDEIQAYHEVLEAWQNLSLSGVKTYALNVSKAIELLEGDGWTLNRSGEAFDPETDEVRCKLEDGELLALDLKMIYPEGNKIGDMFEKTFLSNLEQAGIKVTLEARPMTALLDVYYRNVERDCDMIYLATNFATVFDPSYTFNPADAYQGSANRSAIADEALYQCTVNMRMTEPGDVLTYLQKWIAFQIRWSEVLPAIPVYSNMYHDFYTSRLKDYQVKAGLTWGDAIIGSYLLDTTESQEDAEAAE